MSSLWEWISCTSHPQRFKSSSVAQLKLIPGPPLFMDPLHLYYIGLSTKHFYLWVDFLCKHRNQRWVCARIFNLEIVSRPGLNISLSKLLQAVACKQLNDWIVSGMVADSYSLAQIGAKFDRGNNVIWKFLYKNEEHRQAYLAVLKERGFYHTNMIEPLVLKIKNGEMRPDVNRVTISGCKWIASLFHPNLLSEKLIGNITHYEASIQVNIWRHSKVFLKNGSVRSRKEKAKRVDGQLELAGSSSWLAEHISVVFVRLGAIFRLRRQYAYVRGDDRWREKFVFEVRLICVYRHNYEDF